MASDYRHENGYGIALVDLDLIVPQPQGGFVQPVQRNPSASGVVHEQGLFAPLRYNVLTVAKYTALLTQFGLSSVLQAEGTWYLPNHAFVPARYNGIVVRPQLGVDLRRAIFLKDITFMVIKLVAL